MLRLQVTLVPSFELSQQLARLQQGVSLLLERIDKMSPELQRLTDEVAETKQLAASSVTLINGLAQQIRDNANDPAALNALADDLDGSNKEIADAVTANTPAAPTP